MPATVAQPVTGPPETAVQPKHPLHMMTTYELRDYRRQLEQAIEYFDMKKPVPPVQDDLQARLEEAVAEQEDRKRIANA